MIDPNNVTNFKRSNNELEEFLLFSIAVAGKTASTTAFNLERLLWFLGYPSMVVSTPFDAVRRGIRLDKKYFPDTLKQHGFGCYHQRARSFKEIVEANLNLKTCTLDDLERIYGIGMKTSRFFLLHSRPNVHAAVLDTHILKFMRDQKIAENVPKQTPSSKKRYLELEEAYLNYIGNCNLAEVDLNIWRQYANK